MNALTGRFHVQIELVAIPQNFLYSDVIEKFYPRKGALEGAKIERSPAFKIWCLGRQMYKKWQKTSHEQT